MTNHEWKQRSADRILKAVRKGGIIKNRELQRATHYNRGPADEGVVLWFQALESLEMKKLVVVKRKRVSDIAGDDELGIVIQSVMTPELAAIMGHVAPVLPPRRRSFLDNL
jgi:hypothetical protein